MKPQYGIACLVGACADAGQRVTVTKGAQDTATSDFHLATRGAVTSFIADGGLEKPEHQNTRLWEKNPFDEPVYVDAFDFYSGRKCGYIAFYKSPMTGAWVIKSFKKNTKGDPRNLVFARIFEDDAGVTR